MTTFIGIDQSYRSSGVVILERDGTLRNHEIVSTFTSDGDYFARAKSVSEDISLLCLRAATGNSHNHVLPPYDVYIGIEGLAFGMRGHTLQNLAGLRFMIINALRDRGMNATILTPSKVKKFATGFGRASKPDMFNALPPHIQTMFSSVSKANGREDLTDAYFIAELMRTTHAV